MVTQKEIFYQYILKERDRREEEVIQLRQKLRMKNNIDAVDCLELSLALERLNSFIDYSNHAIAIFKLSCPADIEANMIKIDFTEYITAAKELQKFKKERVKK